MSKSRMDQFEELAEKMDDEQLFEAAINSATFSFAKGLFSDLRPRSINGDVPVPLQELVVFKREMVRRMSGVRELEKTYDVSSHALLEKTINERVGLFVLPFMEGFKPQGAVIKEIPAGPWGEFVTCKLEILRRMAECRRLKKK